MDGSLLQSLAATLGLAGLALGVFFLLYRQVLALDIFASLSRKQTFSLLLVVVGLIFLLVVLTVVDFPAIAVVDGDGNTVDQR